ncbi:unnamed protein product [Rotaria sp. Silwood2]|nr:unnamed protein product [Rotaria sp. Silwood2]CAF2601366.1 unnamed protein product [Rotaria sp. Silwood2]CAF2827635.1 unnamed protein product [Rotaria sp. Silwood2]CAF3991573.1 unnamed protein product [Rotaria sp. Silwood2]CAF4162784.1 unnamed protein product [Rotaria sp. Silwood2]
MASDIDSIIHAPTSYFLSTVTPNDLKNNPQFAQIYNFLRDPLATTFNMVPFNGIKDVNRNTSHNVVDPLVDSYKHSTTVNPVYTIPSVHESQISHEEQLTDQSKTQFDCSKSGKIKIKDQPRAKFRPRTEKESKESSHYLRCEDNIKSEYPTIYISQAWIMADNIIQITLVGIDRQPHAYTIDNKERKVSSLIFKQEEEPHSLYFHVTKEDFDKGEKSFLIEYIKRKQDDEITKQLIKNRQFYQSMLRFTRFYLTTDGTYQSDEASTEYSSIMTEHYGDFMIEDIFPLYGPMCGNEKVCIELKGPITRNAITDLTITIVCNNINWFYQVQNIKKNGSSLTFLMPPFPSKNIIRAKVNIIIEYKQEIIQQSDYIYTKTLDVELNENNCNESNSMVAVGSSSLNNFYQMPDVFPISSSTPVQCENRATKRFKTINE